MELVSQVVEEEEAGNGEHQTKVKVPLVPCNNFKLGSLICITRTTTSLLI